MKTAEKYSMTAKASSIVNEEKGTVKIRMADFYPGYNGEQEYCEVSMQIYEEFYAPKTIEDRKGTISIKLNDMYPHMENGDRIITIEKSLYYEVIENRQRNHTVTIKLKELYPKDTSLQEFVEVSDSVYKEFVKNKRKDHALEVQDCRYRIKGEFNEEIGGTCTSTEDSEKDIHFNLLIDKLFAEHGEELRKVAHLFFIDGYDPTQIAGILHKNKPNVWKAIRVSKQIVRNAGIDYFY